MTTPKQLDFFLAFFRPLMTVEEVCDRFDGSHKTTIHAWLDEGWLLGADIRTPAADRRSVRVYKYSVEHRLIDPETKPVHVPVNKILAHGREKLFYPEVAGWLSCSVEHIKNLRLDGPRYGERTQRIYAAALIEFLESRWIA